MQATPVTAMTHPHGTSAETELLEPQFDFVPTQVGVQ